MNFKKGDIVKGSTGYSFDPIFKGKVIKVQTFVCEVQVLESKNISYAGRGTWSYPEGALLLINPSLKDLIEK